MSFIPRAKEVLLYDGLTQNEYKVVEPYILKENNKRLKIYNYVAFFAILIVFIISLLWDNLAPKRMAYILGLASNLVMVFLLSKYASKSHHISKIVNYYFISLMLFFTIYIGTVTGGGLPAVTFFTCLALVPYITYSKVLYGFLHRFAAVVIFIVLSYSYKPVEHFYTDLFNVLVVFIISTSAGIYCQKLQVNSYIVKNNMDIELKKMSGLFEKIRIIDLVDLVSTDYSIYSNDDRRLAARSSDAIEQMDKFVDSYIGDYHRENMRQFLDLTTLEDRMYESKILERDFISVDGIWDRAIFVAIEEDSKGFPTKVAFSIKRIADQYYLKALEINIHNMP